MVKLSFIVELLARKFNCVMAICVLCPFPHVSEDDQRSLILARSWSHPPITVQVCKITSG